MMEQYLAHSAQNGHLAQSYKEHIENTKNLALIFAEKMKQYCSKDAGKIENILSISAESHDFGKLLDENQEVLHQENGKKTADQSCGCRSGFLEAKGR